MTCARRGNTCCRRRAAKHRLLSSSRRNAQRALVRAFGCESTWLELVNYHSGDAYGARSDQPAWCGDILCPAKMKVLDGLSWSIASANLKGLEHRSKS